MNEIEETSIRLVIKDDKPLSLCLEESPNWYQIRVSESAHCVHMPLECLGRCAGCLRSHLEYQLNISRSVNLRSRNIRDPKP